jgi:integrase
VGSLFEAHLAYASRSPNSKAAGLYALPYVLTYAEQSGFDIEARLLQGQPFLPHEMRGFAYWLEQRFRDEHAEKSGPGTHLPAARRKTLNNILYGAQRFEEWFVETYYQSSTPGMRAAEAGAIRGTQKRLWESLHQPIKQKPEATDLTDDEIRAIETYLRGIGWGPNATQSGARLYLTWRLAIELGLRIGEILSLRLEDCPTRTRPSFRIVRIEERGGQRDPRAKRPPRPKTLGRELTPIFANSMLTTLVSEYQSVHRYGWKTSQKTGKRIKDHAPAHPYLLVDKAGKPVEQHTASEGAQLIAKETGIPFTWHMARHAFFNRAYAALTQITNPNEQNTRTMDLVYWGGWSDPDSLLIYSQRARRENAQSAFSIWQTGGQTWSALG